jgi:hypothetical protein
VIGVITAILMPLPLRATARSLSFVNTRIG